MKCFKSIFILLFVFSFNCNFAQDTTVFIPSVDIRIDSDSIKSSYRCSFTTSSLENITDYNNGRFSNSQLFTDIDLSSFELISANLKFQEKDNVQKVVFSPIRLIGVSRCAKVGSLLDYITDIKINLTQANGISVLGAGIGFDNSSPRSTRSRKIVNSIFDSFPSPEASKLNEKLDDYKKRVIVPYKKKLDSLALLVYEARAKSIFTFNIGYNQRFFSILSAKSDIPLYDSTNYYGTESNVWSATTSYSYNLGSITLGLGYNFSQTRQSAAKGQEKILYNGLSFSLNKRVLRFITNKEKLKKNEAYQNSLFIPGIHFGFIYEQLKTNSDKFQFVKDKRISRVIYTPAIDILISPAAQFRLSFPITKDKTFDDVKTRFVGSSISYVLKLSNLSK